MFFVLLVSVFPFFFPFNFLQRNILLENVCQLLKVTVKSRNSKLNIFRAFRDFAFSDRENWKKLVTIAEERIGGK